MQVKIWILKLDCFTSKCYKFERLLDDILKICQLSKFLIRQKSFDTVIQSMVTKTTKLIFRQSKVVSKHNINKTSIENVTILQLQHTKEFYVEFEFLSCSLLINYCKYISIHVLVTSKVFIASASMTISSAIFVVFQAAITVSYLALIPILSSRFSQPIIHWMWSSPILGK